MTTRASSFGGGRLLLGAGAAALLLLGGCVMAPVDPYYDVGTPVTTYPYGPSYVAPAYPAYPSYSAPYYYGPSMSLGIYGGWSDNDRRGWRDRPRRPNWGDRDGPRPGWNGHNGQRPGWRASPDRARADGIARRAPASPLCARRSCPTPTGIPVRRKTDCGASKGRVDHLTTWRFATS